MKVRDTSPGRLYALSSEIGCTAINGAMAVDIPAGGQVVVLALDKKIVIDGDDGAKFVEVRWGTNTVVGSRPVPAWLSDVLSGLISIVGDDKFDISYMPAENKLYLQFSLEVTTAQIKEVNSLLERELPSNLVVEMEWADGLPMTYTRLEYLEGNPNTQINIPYATDAETGLSANYMPLSNKISSAVLMAADSTAINIGVPHPSPGYADWVFKFGIYDYSVATNYKELEYLTGSTNYLNSKSGVTVLDGKESTTSRPNASFNGFANSLRVMQGFYRLRWAKVSQGNKVVMHLVPALDQDQRPCLYDLIQKKTYYSPSGKLSYNASEEYTPVDYLETTGGQYTRAAIVPNSQIGCRASFSVAQQINYPLICYAQGSNYAYYLFAAANVDPGYSYIRWGSANPLNTNAWFNIGEESVQELNWLNSKVVKGNNKPLFTLNSDMSFLLRSDLYLFANSNTGTASPVNEGARLYSVEFSEYSTAIRHFVPALDSIGAPCFIETMSGVPFYNLGTGDFLYPGKETEVTTYSLRRPQTYAQVTANGIRRLYHVPKGYNGTKEEYAAEYGFKPIIETPYPEEGYWTPEWRETEEEIILEWIETEPPTEEDTENA